MDYPMITEEERQFLAYVKAHRHMGYGRMMQIIGNAWYRRLHREYPGTEAGVFMTCLGVLPEEQQRAFLSVLQAEEQAGMEY